MHVRLIRLADCREETQDSALWDLTGVLSIGVVFMILGQNLGIFDGSCLADANQQSTLSSVVEDIIAILVDLTIHARGCVCPSDRGT